MIACMLYLFSLFEDFICIDDEVLFIWGIARILSRGFSQRFEIST
jgi:hypothetical protein